MSKPSLSDRTKKELSALARRRGIRGYESMTKEALVKALIRALSSTTSKKPARAAKPVVRTASRPAAVKAATRPTPNGTHKPATNGTARRTPAPAKGPPLTAAPVAKAPAPPTRVEPPKTPVRPFTSAVRVEAIIPADKDLSVKVKGATVVKDRILLTAPDPFWLHAFWELSIQSVQRAEAALGQDWHGAKPIIRVFDVTSQDTTSTSEAPIRDIIVHGGCSHWYIDVPQPPRSYRADIGYLTRAGRFFVLARSNVVMPPKAGASETLEDGLPAGESGPDRDAADPMAQARELIDSQFRRPMKDTPFGSGAVLPGKLKKFSFDLDAELIVYGKTDPTASVTLQNEPVKLRPDGTFTMRFSLPDSRQIIPAVATSTDGMEEQTIVLAVERNTKRLDPMIHDLYGEN
jgi:hypothetical protein